MRRTSRRFCSSIHSRFPVSLFFLLLAAALGLVVVTPLALAQDDAQPTLMITGMDFSNLPNVDVTVSGSNLGAPLADLPAVLQEDKVEQPIIASTAVDVGIATGFLIDASDNIRSAGNTGDPRFVEIANAVERFVQMRILAAETDWLGAFTVNAGGEGFQQLAGWDRDHQGVVNQLRLYQPQELAVSTPLFNLIKYGLDQVEIAPFPDRLRRSLVVFSDGFDSLSAVEIDDVVNRANRLGVTIHTVMVGPEEESRRQNLQRISDLTGGQYVLYSALTDMEPLWRQLAAERRQQQYTYRLTKAEPELLEIAVTTPNQRTFGDEIEFDFVPLQPAQVTILQPAGDAVITRTGAAPDSAAADLQPATLDIQLDVQWPDGHGRNFDRIDYEVGGRTLTQADEPFTSFAFPLADLDDGAHTLRAFVYDELGLESQSAPRTFEVELVWPTAVPPTPEPEATELPPATAVIVDDSGAFDTAGEEGDGLPQPATVVTLTGGIADGFTPAFSWSLGALTVEYGADSTGASQLRAGSYTIPVNWMTVSLAALPFVLLIGVLMFAGRRRKVEDAPFATAAYDPSTVADNKSTMIEATAYELTEDATEAQPIVDFESPATLLYVEGGEHLPARLNIEGGREIRIGRKAAYCDIIIDDQRVSRLHASIHEREDGNFYLKDEGSSGGTFVNRRKLRVNDAHLLAHGDVINFNTVAYRFELADAASATPAGAAVAGTSNGAS